VVSTAAITPVVNGRQRRTAWRQPVMLAIAAVTAVAVALRLYQFTRPGYLTGLTEYDDGSYFGSAVRLLHGVLPYRDFVFVQPPGITLLMTPAALLAKVAGTQTGMVAGRILTALAGAAGAGLAGILVRHRGVLAVLAAGGLVAVYPGSIAAAHTVLVEPWLVLFCLLGALAVFDGDRLASGRRLIWGGAAFGFAGAVEPWAIAPVLVLLALCLPEQGRLARFGGGVAAGFLIPTVPFVALAPKRFYTDLIVAQVAPRAGAARVGLLPRLTELAGLSQVAPQWGYRHLSLPFAAPAAAATGVVIAIIVVLAVGGLAALVIVHHRPPTALECFAAASTALIVLMFCWPSQFHYHFPAFLAPFLGLAIALPASRLLGNGGPGDAAVRPRRPARYLAAGTAAALVALLAGFQLSAEQSITPDLAPAAIAAAGRAIPLGSCVGTDEVALLILANRFTANTPGCPAMIDGTGTDLALSHGRKPQTGAARYPAVVAAWRQELSRARFVWLSPLNRVRITWTRGLRRYFAANFTRLLVLHSGNNAHARYVLYRRSR
jgi:alpha-1,2-mannosyltransferase